MRACQATNGRPNLWEIKQQYFSFRLVNPTTVQRRRDGQCLWKILLRAQAMKRRDRYECCGGENATHKISQKKQRHMNKKFRQKLNFKKNQIQHFRHLSSSYWSSFLLIKNSEIYFEESLRKNCNQLGVPYIDESRHKQPTAQDCAPPLVVPADMTPNILMVVERSSLTRRDISANLRSKTCTVDRSRAISASASSLEANSRPPYFFPAVFRPGLPALRPSVRWDFDARGCGLLILRLELLEDAAICCDPEGEPSSFPSPPTNTKS
jgi:hypothetical protein